MKLRFKVINQKMNDSIIIEADGPVQLKEVAFAELQKRGWNKEDCYSEEINTI